MRDAQDGSIAGQGTTDTSEGDLRSGTPVAVETCCAAEHSHGSTVGLAAKQAWGERNEPHRKMDWA